MLRVTIPNAIRNVQESDVIESGEGHGDEEGRRDNWSICKREGHEEQYNTRSERLVHLENAPPS